MGTANETPDVKCVPERRRVTLERAAIRYIESNDSEVYVHTLQGETYRTKTEISQWEALLDERFVRIHRSYIVHSLMVARYRAGRAILADGGGWRFRAAANERAHASGRAYMRRPRGARAPRPALSAPPPN